MANNLTIGLLAHVDAGKTTLAEAILYRTGQIRNLGRVDHQDCFLDTDAIERQRGITIFSKEARTRFGDRDVTLMDTPGHVDFSAEMERNLSVLDAAILVISGSDGVQGHTRTLWRLLNRYDVPTFLFVNKMDQPQANRDELLSEIQNELDSSCIDFLLPRTQLDEEIAGCDELLMEQYLDSNELSDEMISDAILGRKAFPVYFGSALHTDGIDELIEGIGKYADSEEYGEKFAARVFKISRDANGKRLTHMKIMGDKLTPKQMIVTKKDDSGEQILEKIDQIRRYEGDKYTQLNEAVAGDIVAITGLENTYAGQGLGEMDEDEIPILEPVLEYCMILPREIDALQALPSLKLLEEEDPQLHIVWQEEHREIHIRVMGQIQIQILKEKIKDRFDIAVEFGNGRTVYKETLAAPSYGIGHFEPLRHYAEVQVIIEPGERGSGIQFATICSEDVLSKNWQRLIATHVEETIHPGVLTRSEATDLRIILVTGKAHTKHTEGGDFRQATYRAIRNGLRNGQSVLLEPMYRFVLEVPTEYVGRAMMDIEKYYGTPELPEVDKDISILRGRVPVSTFQDYQLELQAYTAGEGRLSLVFDGYAPCHNSDEVIEKRNYDPDMDMRRPTGSVFCAHGSGYQVPWYEVAAMAHMECPVNMEEYSEHWAAVRGGDSQLEDLSAMISESKIKAQDNLSNARVRSVSDTISIEEIDAILGSTFRKNENKKRDRRYHKTSVTVSAGNGTYKPQKKRSANRYLLVDGYNIIFAWQELKDISERTIDGARDKLIDICCDYQGYTQETLILVFDAYKVKGSAGSVQKVNNIYVVYTKEAETADVYIQKTTHELAKDNIVTVATSDYLEQMIIWGDGALRMSAREFEEVYNKSRVAMRENYLNKGGSVGNTVGEALKNIDVSSGDIE